MKKEPGLRHDAALAAPLDERSVTLRHRLVDVLASASRGHLGASASLMEIMRVLYDDVLSFDPVAPDSPARDRCILSKGHGCIAQYVMLADKGFFPLERLGEFCADGGLLGGHPCASKIPGVEVSTGALGHGLPVGVGMALALKADRNPARVFAVMGDGECNEGSVWEAAMSAAKHGLENLTAMVDYNKFQSYGETAEVAELEPFADKWRSFGFAVREVNGHDVDELRKVLKSVPFEPGKPSALICHTVKGKGFPFAENNLEWHHKSNISEEQAAKMREAIG
ncbi:transketolase [Pseudodesulfovibrio cashew]|uniref:Transketolase n=1 Tax=Pseudodesulfovibrio cashew TaxID=2678688 RepID=A0A6I6JG47_9BACT|nr:transketolase [Pseudodesulfovibrio cashew]QGY39372.1 transketolase [Pseudodesulfovibrio cashew]